ncbi:cytochrome P450 [Dactylosporangium matsuzakiense]|uniref:Cytochrome P450 n=1 Tax=Dactylosporangium matsuzakiense TaxID=53360 RepID=A0A9W6NMR1_9ACTN|nr:cytochrome P450 [Dactylosporangium matsuzakiense]UWZ43061.1 cytochrome P450 [Dactylosporangium matsuzakiense]GLL02516.1 cytochrome P450 [Dactylosporangium matsuzakiense]
MTTAVGSVFSAVLDPVNRHDPYPLFTSLRREPVSVTADGRYVVSTFDAVSALLPDPRLSSAGAVTDLVGLPPSFLMQDPPDHDRLRRLAYRPLGPHWVADLEPKLVALAGELAGDLRPSTVDIVDDFAYPLPIRVICALLGVPLADEPRFRVWIDRALTAVQPDRGALEELAEYMSELRAAPGLLRDLAADGGMSRAELVSTAMLLLIAGHETTVNLIANSALVLLRRPLWCDRLVAEPGLEIRFVEEVLRHDPPVQMLTWRTALDDIPVAGTTIPRGASVTLLLAAANRDPARFAHPDRFDPDRRPAPHLAFGAGIHYCFGAPLARLEAQVALRTLAPILAGARLLEDPPEYRLSAVLRGPRHLRVALDHRQP